MATKAKKSTSKTSKKRPAEKKVTTQKATKKKTSAKKAAAGSVAKKKTTQTSKVKKSSSGALDISAEERWRMIAVTAYLKAEARKFAPGHETEDWLQAEKEVEALIGGKK